jgi:hypothetical protein
MQLYNAVIQCSYKLIFFDSLNHPNFYKHPLNAPTSRNNNSTHSLVSTPLVHTRRTQLLPSSLTTHGNSACVFRGHRQADSCPIRFLLFLFRLGRIGDRSMFCSWSCGGHIACSRWIHHQCMTWRLTFRINSL